MCHPIKSPNPHLLPGLETEQQSRQVAGACWRHALPVLQVLPKRRFMVFSAAATAA